MGPITKLIRQHQMKDERWTMTDKVTQYRGLFNLYTRDRKQIQEETEKTVANNWKAIRQITTDIEYYRKRLNNAISDKQRVRNALANYQLFLKAFEHLKTEEIVENIDHRNFVKRKQINSLKYKLANRENLLLKLQVEEVTVEENIRIERATANRREEQVIVNKINNLNIRQNTAATIQFNYFKVMEILKKDALYYDTVLRNLRQDHLSQCKCIFRTTEMGQLATEDLDTLRHDYKSMEKTVKADMKMRDNQVAALRDEVQQMFTTCKLLTRTESDAVVGILGETASDTDENTLPKELERLEEILRKMQEVTAVPNFSSIFPRMETQVQERVRITKQLSMVREKRNVLQNSQQHAVAMIAHMEHSEDQCNKMFEQESVLMKEKLRDVDSNHEELTVTLEDIAHHLSRIRFSLQTLEQQLERVRDPDETSSSSASSSTSSAEEQNEETLAENEDNDKQRRETLDYDSSDTVQDPEQLLSEIQNKIQLLSTQLFVSLDARQNEKAQHGFEQQIINNQSGHFTSRVTKGDVDTPLVAEHEVEDAQVLTRDGVKARSANIVTWFERPLELQLMDKMMKK